MAKFVSVPGFKLAFSIPNRGSDVRLRLGMVVDDNYRGRLTTTMLAG
jgi:hypothetical protein